MKNKLVSIIIPCYNAEKYLEDCLNSILNQTYKNIEVIAVNDGSKDNTEKIIDIYRDKFKHNDMKLIKINQENSGQATAVNKALKYVKGEYLMWQDADDWYENDAVENLYNFLNKENEYNLVRANVAFREEKNISEITRIGKSSNPNNDNIFDSYVFETDSYCYSGIFMVKMEHFDKCIANREIYESRAGQNWQLILPISYKEKCGYLNKVVYNYRIVENSHSHSVKKISDLLKRCDAHKDILINVISKIDKMNQKDKKIYINKIRIKYLKKKIRIMLSKIKHFIVR